MVPPMDHRQARARRGYIISVNSMLAVILSLYHMIGQNTDPQNLIEVERDFMTLICWQRKHRTFEIIAGADIVGLA